MAERLVVARLGAGGDGIADTPDGPVPLPGVLPGEVALVERDGGAPRLLGRETDSPDRIAPFCPYYARCGGCVAQHVGPALYAAWKRDKVVAALRRAGVPAEVEPLRDAHGEGRRRVTFHAREGEGGMQVGFMEAGSHRLVAIQRCPVTCDGLADAAPVAMQLAKHLSRTGKPIDVSAIASDGGLDVDLRGSGTLEDGVRQALIREAGALQLARLSLHGEVLVAPGQPGAAVGRAHVLPPPGAFLQATRQGEDILASLVVEACAGRRRIADLFAGIGPFALRLAEKADVHAVETDAAALAALDRAARETPGLRRVTTERRDLFRRPLLPPELDRFDAIVLDPPRAGAEAQTRQLILSSRDRVILASCDPGTFSRDAAILAGGGFRATRVVPVDQFKWSAHVEIVGVFDRARPARAGRRRRQG